MHKMATVSRTLILSILLILLVMAFAACDSSKDQPQSLVIMHFNDFHGQLMPYKSGTDDQSPEVAGIAKLSKAVMDLKNQYQGTPSLLLFAGDLLQGTRTSSLYYGWPDTEMFMEMGVDAAVMGNHELDYGQDKFKKIVSMSSFPFLAANIEFQGEALGTKPYTILVQENGLRVGILGLVTEELVTATHPKNSVGITMSNPIETAKKYLPEIEQKSDVVVVLSHMGIAQDRELAETTTGVDVIIGGHNHNVLEKPEVVSNVLIVQAGERGRYLGCMELQVAGNQVHLQNYRLIELDQQSAMDEEMMAKVKKLADKADADVKEVVGKSLNLLDGNREVIRRKESNLGDFVADIAKENTGAQIALLNGGGFRDSIREGQVRIMDVYNVFPFRNTLITGRVNGEALMRILNLSASYLPEDNPGGFLQVAGMKFTIENKKATDVTVGGKPIAMDEQYTIVTSDYLAEGGDAYNDLLSMKDKTDTGLIISDLVIGKFRSQKEIRAETDGRITRK